MSTIDSIRFRMYNTGSVGDCLLLLFQRGGDIAFSMLIDCGGWMTKKEAISACVEDIHATCNGKLDLLVLTHEHMDHVSGFNQARAVFDRIEVGKVWMSWIEDESDDIAKILKDLYGKKMQELKRAAEMAITSLKRKAAASSHVRGMNARAKAQLRTMEDTLELLRLEDGVIPMRGAKASLTNSDAVSYLKGKAEPRYLKPGEVISDLEGAEGMKFYVLGPPRDRDMRFFKIATEEDEMYKLAVASPSADKAGGAGVLNHAFAWLINSGSASVLNPGSAGLINPAFAGVLNPAFAKEDENLSSFNEPIVESGISLEEGQSPFGEQYILQGKEKEAFLKEYNSVANRWRQIETDWLENAASIAMRVTALTNNTSLAMAIEFGDSGRVVLLPGDAQSGNWMGWHKPTVMRSLKKKGGKDTAELLANTIFYKVGHHGSHNGTASVSGLNHVQNDDLVVFMPLVQDKVPSAWGGSENFPDKSLYRVLIEKSRGRLVRTDVGVIQDARAKKFRAEMKASEKKEFTDSFKKGPNWVEYVIKG